MAEADVGSRASFWLRLAATAGMSLVPLLLLRIPLPGVLLGRELLDAETQRNTSLFVLGVAPIASAYVAVELFALLVPKLRQLRSDYPRGRSLLTRATMVLSLVIAGCQAFFIGMALERVQGEEWLVRVDHGFVVGSLVATTALCLFLVRLIDHLGLTSGVLILSLVGQLPGSLNALPSPDPGTRPYRLPLACLLYGLPPLLTWAALRSAGSPNKARYHIPLSSLQPLTASVALLALPRAVSELTGHADPGLSVWLFICNHPLSLLLATAVALSVGLAYLFQRPGKHWYKALAWTLAFVTALLLIDQISAANDWPRLAVQLALFTSLTLDVAGALKLHHRYPDLVCVNEERRPFVMAQLLAAARRDDVVLHATGQAPTTLLRIFGPYACVRFWCKPRDAERARASIAASYANPQTAANPRNGFGSAQAVLAAGASAVVLIASVSYEGGMLLALGNRMPRPRARIEASWIDDQQQSLAVLRDRKLPAGLSLRYDHVGGYEERRKHLLLWLKPGADENFEIALARVEPTLQTLALPAGTRLAWQHDSTAFAIPVSDDESDDLRAQNDVYASYVVRHATLFTTTDVMSVERVVDSEGTSLALLRLSPDAARQLALETRKHLGQRLAISINGRVHSAPVVKSELTAGIIQIRQGALPTAEDSRNYAEALVDELAGVN